MNQDTRTDQDLIKACLTGKSQAYETLVKRHQKMVLNVLYRILGSREASQDVSQEAFITAYEKLHMFSGHSKFSTWLCQIALNKARDLLRGRGVDSLCEDLEGHKEAMNVSDGDSPDRNMETSQENSRVQSALNKLSSHYREVLILKYFAGYSNQDIAEMLADTVGNVKVTMFRARQVFMQAYVELV